MTYSTNVFGEFFDTNTVAFTLVSATDLALTTTDEPYFVQYDLTVTGVISADLQAELDFQVLVRNPCVEPYYVTVTSVSLDTFLASYYYKLGDPTLSIELPNDFAVDQLPLKDLCGSVATRARIGLDLADMVSEEYSTDDNSQQVKTLHLLAGEG